MPMHVDRLNWWFPFVAVAIGLLTACGAAKTGLADGRYRGAHGPVMVQVTDDSIRIRSVAGAEAGGADLVLSPSMPAATAMEAIHLDQYSLDVDVLTTLIKYRPAREDQQPLLETNLSGALYVGYRVDHYMIRYTDLGFAQKNRVVRHMGLSAGLFAGLGGTAMNPWVTRQAVAAEYTGVVLSSGISLIAAVGNTTLGFAVGADRLLDRNADRWIHEGKPWLGLVFGLNLN